MQAKVAILLARDRRVRAWLLVVALATLCLPVIVGAGTVGLLAEDVSASCQGAGGEGPATLAPGVGSVAARLYAMPLQLKPGRSYQVGATRYGGPGDPSSGDYGAIPDPAQSYLPAHPASFAELSLLDGNPGSSLSFAQADALSTLPYLTELRVTHDGHSEVLAKRDIGYGQGPGQFIANGQPYRLDVWWQAARALDISKSAVAIALVPPGGAAATLEELPHSSEAAPGTDASEEVCVSADEAGSGPLALVAGTQTKILPSGLAGAGEGAPAKVKAMVAAGNRLFGAAYLFGGGHGPSLSTLQPAYDCSSAVSYLLHWGGELGQSALDSSELATYGDPGPGRYVSIYANAAHAFMYVAGLRFDTVEDPAFDSGPNSGKPGPRWRVSSSVPDWATWSVRHPPGL